MNSITACPLDCYDACGVVYDNGKLKAIKNGHTSGFLCPHLNHYMKHEQITMPRYNGEVISMDEALLKLKEILTSSKSSDILHYRGNANFGLMQEVTDHFFTSFGATLTDGSLCDGAGEAGITQGRGSNLNMPLSEIRKSEVVIIWGRNPHTTSSHLLPIIKDKIIIVIDPIKTKIAKMADLFIQIKPHGDLYLALLMVRFLHIEGGCDEDFLEKYATDFEEYYELTQNVRIKATLDEIDVTLGQIGKVLEFVKNRKVAIVCGVGIQKYSDGADIMRAIDALGVWLGLFGREGCGVSYLGNSKDKITSPFNTKASRVSKVNTEFSNFETVFIQSANPLSQMPNTLRVKESMKNVKNIIYFGLYENETSSIANLIIPAKSFLYKNDVRTSYSHNAMMLMPKVDNINNGISEYDLSVYLSKEFNIPLESEEFYLNYFKNFSIKNIDGDLYVQGREEIPYKDGFNTKNKKFEFLEEFDADFNMRDNLFLITPKSSRSLNSQFNREDNVYLNSSHGFIDNEKILISSSYGSVELKVKISNDIREDCVLIYSGTKGVNNLTSSKQSFDGKSAVFQEEKVEVTYI